MATLVGYPLFHGFDRDGLPLEGGFLSSYEPGTSTPKALYHDPELTQAWTNPIELNGSGEALIYSDSSPVRLVLTDANDVLIFDLEYNGMGGSGSTGAAGVGWGKHTVVLTPSAGTAQASAVVFPPEVLALGLTVWLETTIGQSQGLSQVGVGTTELPDCWGLLPTLTTDTESTAGVFLGYHGQPMPTSGMVTLTAYGGLFDGAGTVYLTGHFLTLRPGHEPGYLYTSSTPEAGQILPPQPAATESQAGLIELATQAEVTAGTDAARAVTPLTLATRLTAVLPQSASETVAGLVELATATETTTGTDTTRAVTPAALAAKVPSGVGLSLLRYAASGTALEAAPLTVLSDTKIALGTTTPLTTERITLSGAVDELPLGVVATTTSLANQSPVLRLLRRSTGIMADNFGLALSFLVGDTDGVDNTLGHLTCKRQGADNSGRFTVRTANAGTLAGNTAPGDLAVDPVGNVSLNVDVLSAGGTRVLALGQGTAPSSGPADAVQMWSADRGGVAGKNSLHVRSEDGTSHVLGDVAGHGTLCAATLGSGASYAALNVRGGQLYVNQSSVQERPQALIAPSFTVATDATRESRLALSVYDATASREFLRGETASGAARIGFLGASASARITLPAAATDLTTTTALANALRTLLITFGLGV